MDPYIKMHPLMGELSSKLIYGMDVPTYSSVTISYEHSSLNSQWQNLGLHTTRNLVEHWILNKKLHNLIIQFIINKYSWFWEFSISHIPVSTHCTQGCHGDSLSWHWYTKHRHATFTLEISAIILLLFMPKNHSRELHSLPWTLKAVLWSNFYTSMF